MAYIPAHKRPLPTPELLAPQFWKQGMHTVFSADTRPTAPAAARGGRPGTFRGRGKGYRGISATSGMGYVPPHKWHSKESERPLLTSELRAQRFKKNLYAKPYNKSNVDWTGRIAFADHSTYRWCAAAARGGRPGTLHGRGKGYRGFRGGISARSGMAHIPPHKQHSKEYERPLLTSELHAQRFKKNLHVKPYNKSNVDWTGRIAHADHSTYRWCAVALGEENQFPPSVNLKPICLYSTEPKVEENRLALFNTSLDDGGELKWNSPRSPGVSIAENVLADLVSSIKHMRNEMKCAQLKEGKPTLLARVGKVLFLRRPLFKMEAIRTSLSTEILKQWRRLLYTNIPVSYKERIENEVVPKIGVDFEGEKDTYQVKLSDSTRPDATLSCKCRVLKEHGKLQLYKASFLIPAN